METRIRALKVYSKHNQQNAIDFVNYVIKKFPFRIKMIRTDNGHKFQARFHWRCIDVGIEHVYIKPGSPNLNGKVERSHRTDKQEFYQLLEYTGDVDLNKKKYGRIFITLTDRINHMEVQHHMKYLELK